MNLAGLLGERGRDIARAAYDGIAVYIDILAVLAGADDGAVPDLLENSLKIGGVLCRANHSLR